MRLVKAIYHDGVFVPTEPVNLPDKTQVTVITEALQLNTEIMTAGQLAQYFGTFSSWPADPVDWQRKQREEEWL